MQYRVLFLVIVGCAVLVLCGVVWEMERSRNLTVAFLNVGQGDAVFIESPTGVQVLVDGGPDRSVLRELGKMMPWWDRHIDMIIATHPDADHISGLVDVLQRYTANYILRPGVQNDTPQTESLLLSVAQEGAKEILARRGQVYDLGGGVYLEILFPDRGVSGLETNTASIVARVVYGNTSVMLSGDSPQAIEEYLVALDGERLQSTILKAGHHGSKTSSAVSFVGYVAPETVVFSRGCDNRYGHPHQEVVDLFARFEIPTKDTCDDGTVIFESDGTTLVEK